MSIDYKNLIQPKKELTNAQVRDFQSNPQSLFQRLTFDLTTARTEADAYPVPFGFKCVYVELATDTSTTINLKPNTKISNVGYMSLGRKDVLDFESRLNGAFLYWSAQSAKSITLVFMFDASFKSGSQISQNSGGVSINEGSSFDAQTRVTLAATTAAAIFPANTDRKVGVGENNSGADIYVGSATVTNSGATRGILLPHGGQIIWKNTAALYGYSVAGGDFHYIDEE